MDAATELLSAALDPSGWIAIVGLYPERPDIRRAPIQNFFAPGQIALACTKAKELDDQGYNAYFATSTFLTNETRKAPNVKSVKVFKVDLDVAKDDDKKYATKREAVEALDVAVRTTGLPTPVMVDSGFGVHAYWVLLEALNPTQAKLYAEKLKQIMVALHVKCDPTVTADLARILRVPGTHNYKVDGFPRPVVLKGSVELHDTAEMLDHIDRIHSELNLPEPATASGDNSLIPGMPMPAHLQGVKLDAHTKSLLSGKPKSFAVLLQRSLSTSGKESKGCAQIRDIHENQASTPEPKWRAGLSIAKFCEDGEEAIQVISRGHNGYTPEDTIEKAELIPGPFRCATFIDNWPEICEGCPHKGKITSPIMLGDYVPRATEEDNIVVTQNKAVDDVEKEYQIPEYPYPYFRAKTGGVYIHDSDDETNGTEICPLDVYALERLKEDKNKYMMLCRVHHKSDGTHEFCLDAASIGSLDELRKTLNDNGIMVFDKEVYQMRSYLRRWFEVLSQKETVSKVKTQFGWTEGYGSFVVGDREILPSGGTRFSRAAPSLASVVKLFAKRGDFLEWRKAFNSYAAPGMEPYAFCALVGFGSPLMTFTNVRGGLINAYCQQSGTGKSTVLEAALSIWGDPKGAMLNFNDTALARIHRMGIHQHLPICVDEITKMSQDEISLFLLSATQGRGRHRLLSSANSERLNDTTWEALTLASSNTSFSEKMLAEKSGVEGELMRLLEPELNGAHLLAKSEGDVLFGLFYTNYGHAGDIYIQHVMKDIERTRNLLTQVQRRMDKRAGITTKERIWSVTGAVIIAGGILAKECGLHDFDMDKIEAYFVELVNQQRHRCHYTANQARRDDLIAEWVSQNTQNILVVKGGDGRDADVPLREPHGKLYARYERDSKKLFVTSNELRRFMAERNQDLKAYLKMLEGKGIFKGEGSKRLATGTALPNQPQRCAQFIIDDEENTGL